MKQIPTKNRSKWNKKYKRSIRGVLTERYCAMKRRIRGSQKQWASYLGLPILTKDEFILWSIKDPSFHQLFDRWKTCKFKIRYSPSVDRIDSSRGYTIDNIRWITYEENRILGLETAWERRQKQS